MAGSGLKIEFGKFLLEISEVLKANEIKRLKFLVDWERASGESIEAYEIFSGMIEKKQLSPTNFIVLKDLMKTLKREDLVTRISEKEDFFADLYLENIKCGSEDEIQKQEVKWPLHIHIRSECFDDSGVKKRGGTSLIKISGIDCSLHKRGLNIVVLDRKTGIKLAVKSFDTHYSESKTEAHRALEYLKTLTGEQIVLLAIQDDGWEEGKDFPIDRELIRLGAYDPVMTTFRSSLALVGYAGGGRQPEWVTFEQKEPGMGPTEISANIPHINEERDERLPTQLSLEAQADIGIQLPNQPLEPTESSENGKDTDGPGKAS